MTATEVSGEALVEAYEGVDLLSAFAGPEELADYRASLLAKTDHQAAFISQRFPDARSVLEACTGNGRLLVGLSQRFEVLRGFDIAASRVEFAQRWIDELGRDNIKVWKDDIFSLAGLGADRFDLGVCITGAFGYFEAVLEGGGGRAVEKLAGAIAPGGQLLLELYQHPAEIAMCHANSDHTARVWKNLPATDRFRFYLSELKLNTGRMLLHHNKTFIGHHGEIDEGRSEVLKIYTLDELELLLKPLFSDIEIFADWSAQPWRPDCEKLLLCARRRTGHDETT